MELESQSFEDPAYSWGGWIATKNGLSGLERLSRLRAICFCGA